MCVFPFFFSVRGLAETSRLIFAAAGVKRRRRYAKDVSAESPGIRGDEAQFVAAVGGAEGRQVQVLGAGAIRIGRAALALVIRAGSARGAVVAQHELQIPTRDIHPALKAQLQLRARNGRRGSRRSERIHVIIHAGLRPVQETVRARLRNAHGKRQQRLGQQRKTQ